MTMAATILSATPAYAGQWMQDGNGWWWQNDNGSYPAFTWAWCDGNHDGIGEITSLMKMDICPWIQQLRKSL